jgi:hypothetical protein
MKITFLTILLFLQASGADVTKRIRRTVKRAAASAKALKWIEMVRVGKVSLLSELPVLQGPLTVPLGSDALPAEERVCDMLVAQSQFPIVVTLFESGLIELRLQLCSVFPAWASQGSLHSSSSGGTMVARSEVLMLFDRLDVAPSILQGCGSLTSSLSPSLYRDPLHHANVFYVLHAGGMELLALPDLEVVLAELSKAVAGSSSRQPVFPRAELVPLLQRDMLSPNSRLLGMCVVATAAGEYFLAYECEAPGASVLSCLDLLGASGEQAPVAESVIVAQKSEEAPAPVPLHSVAAWVLELRELDKRRPKAIAHFETLSSGRLTRLQQLELATRLADSYKKHAAHVAEGTAILNAASEDMRKRQTEVSKLIQMADAKLGSLAQRAEGLEKFFAVVRKNDTNLKARMTELSGLLTSLRPTLSDEERAYFALLRSKETEIAGLQTNIEGLEKFVDSHPAIFKTPDQAEMIDADLLDDKRMMVLQDNLDGQNEAIAQLVTTVRDLQTKLL